MRELLQVVVAYTVIMITFALMPFIAGWCITSIAIVIRDWPQ
jgi:hypothetical protein